LSINQSIKPFLFIYLVSSALGLNRHSYCDFALQLCSSVCGRLWALF